MLQRIISNFHVSSISLARQNVRTLFVSAPNEAARKGTREKARKKKVKVEIKKVGFIPHNLRKKAKVVTDKHADDSWKQLPTDNVWIGKYYRYHIFSAQEAIKSHVESHHPTMYNHPKAPIYAHIELNMTGEKATRIVENFHRIAPIKYGFNHGEERNILVFTKGNENIEAAKKAGATMAGDTSLIKAIQNGDLMVNDFQYVLAHANILPDLTHIRGLMKKRFPNPKNGTLGNNLEEMIQRFLNGITYSAIKDENQKNFALIVSQFGTLDMDPLHLEDNLSSLLKDIDTVRPKREGKFITRVWIKSPPSNEQLKIDPFVYVQEEKEFVKKTSVSATNEEEFEEESTNEEKKEAVN